MNILTNEEMQEIFKMLNNASLEQLDVIIAYAIHEKDLELKKYDDI